MRRPDWRLGYLLVASAALGSVGACSDDEGLGDGSGARGGTSDVNGGGGARAGTSPRGGATPGGGRSAISGGADSISGGGGAGGAQGALEAGQGGDETIGSGGSAGGAPAACLQQLEHPPERVNGGAGAGSDDAPCWACRPGKACYTPRCGDGHVDKLCLGECWRAHWTLDIFGGDWLEETCDDSNTVSGDGCSSACKLESQVLCGNGRLDPLEQCDDGNAADGDGCTAGCKSVSGWRCAPVGAACVQELCGDGHVSSTSRLVGTGGEGGAGTAIAEDCDDGNRVGGDGCDERCGLQDGWWCPAKGGACALSTCGDGRVGSYWLSGADGEGGTASVEQDKLMAEGCDDGNTRPGDGCDARCRTEPEFQCPSEGGACVRRGCGNKILERYPDQEECDDGNVQSRDGCDADCRLELGWVCSETGSCTRSRCGDGIVDDRCFERCDDGNDVPGDGCTDCAYDGYRCAGAREIWD